MPKSSYRTSLVAFICLGFSLAGCGSDKPKPPIQTATATATPEPSYAIDQAKNALLDAKDLGKDWTNEGLPDAFEQEKLRGCSDSKISLTGSPKIWARKFGAPNFRFKGVNYAQFIAVYPDTTQAIESMERIRELLSKCPSSKSIPRKELPNKRFTYQHDDTWKMTEDKILGWQHIRGFEKNTYPPSLSRINVFYFSIDYAQRGNIIFSSMYWKRVKSKDSGEPIAGKANEVLTEQLKRFG